MLFPGEEEVVVLLVLSYVKKIEEVAFEQSSVDQIGKLKVAGVSFGRGDQIVFGLFSNMAVGEDEEDNGQEPV